MVSPKDNQENQDFVVKTVPMVQIFLVIKGDEVAEAVMVFKESREIREILVKEVLN